jgi:hypothetical protein
MPPRSIAPARARRDAAVEHADGGALAVARTVGETFRYASDVVPNVANSTTNGGLGRTVGGFLVNAGVGAIVGTIVLALLGIDLQAAITEFVQGDPAKTRVTSYLTTGDPAFLEQRAKDTPAIRGPFARSKPSVEITRLGSRDGRVSVDGTKVLGPDGCFSWKGALQLTRTEGHLLFGGRWYIKDASVTRRRIRQRKAPKGWDCRTAVERLDANEAIVTPVSSTSSAPTEAPYGPEAALDYNIQTAWKDGPTANDRAWIRFDLSKPIRLGRISVQNGVNRDTTPEWSRFDRPAQLEIQTDERWAAQHPCDEYPIQSDQFPRRSFVAWLDDTTSNWQELRHDFGRACHVWIYVQTFLDCQSRDVAISGLRLWQLKRPETASMRRTRNRQPLRLNVNRPAPCVRPAQPADTGIQP